MLCLASLYGTHVWLLSSQHIDCDLSTNYPFVPKSSVIPSTVSAGKEAMCG